MTAATTNTPAAAAPSPTVTPVKTAMRASAAFDGPNTADSVQAIASWHVNVVRVLLNEDCWLGINGIKPEYAAANYRQSIVDYVQLLSDEEGDGRSRERNVSAAAPVRSTSDVAISRRWVVLVVELKFE